MLSTFRMISVACLVMHGSSISLRSHKRPHLHPNIHLQTESVVSSSETEARPASDFIVVGDTFISPGDDNRCGEGYSLVTYQEALDNKDAVCSLIPEWEIVRLSGNASINGSGYGCVLKEEDSSELGSGLCAPLPGISPIRARDAVVISGSAEGDLCSLGYSLVSLEEANAYQNTFCNKLQEYDIARISNGGSISGSGHNCIIKETDSEQLGSGLCAPIIGFSVEGGYVVYDPFVISGSFPSDLNEENLCGEGNHVPSAELAFFNRHTLCHMLPEYGIARLSGGGSMSGRKYGCLVKKSDNAELGSAICVANSLEVYVPEAVEARSIADAKVVSGKFPSPSIDSLCGDGQSLVTYQEAMDNKNAICSTIQEWEVVRLAGTASISGSGHGCEIKDNNDSELGSALCAPIPKSETTDENEEEKIVEDEEVQEEEVQEEEVQEEEVQEEEVQEEEVQEEEVQEEENPTENEENADNEIAQTEPKLNIEVSLISHKYPCPTGYKLVPPQYMQLNGQADYLWSEFEHWETARLAGGASIDSTFKILDQDRRNLRQALCGIPEIPQMIVPENTDCPDNYVVVTTDDIAARGNNAFLDVGSEGTFRTAPYGSVELQYDNVIVNYIDSREIEKPVCCRAMVNDVKVVAINEEENCGSDQSLLTIQEAFDNREPLCNLLPEDAVARLAGGASISGSGGNCNIKQYDPSDLVYVFCSPVNRQ